MEGEGNRGTIKVQDFPRSIILSYTEYELLNETLNHYIDGKLRPPNREGVRVLQQGIVERWLAQDKEESAWPD